MVLRITAAAALAALAMPATSNAEVASWYECCNPKTASGYPFSAGNPHIVAHRTLPFGTKLLLTNRANGRKLCVTVRDRGPFVRGVDLDVTRAGAEQLGFKKAGKANVSVVRGC